MVLNIIFSYNRAMQLDYFLTSGLERLKFDTETVVIYHTTGGHADGYRKLIEKFSKHGHIRFEERTPNRLSPYQRLRFSKEKQQRYLKYDNFKEVTERIIQKSSCEFVMFNTDDGFWTDDTYFDEEIQSLIRRNPASVTYRMYVGDNLQDFPDYVKRWGDYYLWDYYADKKIVHWTYPFAVDGTIYDRKTCLSTIRDVWYTNPVSLESDVVNSVMKKELFGIGLSPQKSTLIGTKLNRVSTTTLNPTLHLSPDMLNAKYLQGYLLDLHFPAYDNTNLVPLQVNLVKDGQLENIYELDDFGKTVQKNLGAEGAKKEMQ